MSDEIGRKIKQLRQNLGLTQEELGEIVGVKKAAINKYESGLVKNIKRDMQAKLAKALKTDPASLFYPETDKNASVQISETEQHILSLTSQLNSEGQQKVFEYARDLVSSRQYIKNNQDELVDPDTSVVSK